MNKIINKIKNYKYSFIFLSLFTIAAIYANFIATSKYQSKAVISLIDNSNKETSAAMSLLGLGNTSNDYMRDIRSLKEFLNSSQFLISVDKKFHLKKSFMDRNKSNFYERLSAKSYKEDFVERFSNDLQFFYDPDYNVIELSYIYHDSKISAEILSFIISELEKEINRLNNVKLQNDLKFISLENQKNYKAVQEIKKEIEKFQIKYTMFNPKFNLEEKLNILNSLNKQVVETNLIFKEKSVTLSKYNPELIKIRQKLLVLENKQKEMRKQLFGNKNTGLPINNLIFKYKEKEKVLDFRSELYKQSLLKLESIKLESSKKNKILEVINSPTISERPFFPNNLILLPTLFIIFGLIIFIIRNVINIINEHKD